MRPLAVLGAVPLLAAAAPPGLLASLALFSLVGVCSAFVVPARAAVMTAVPDEVRGRVFGVAASGLAAALLLAVMAPWRGRADPRSSHCLHPDPGALVALRRPGANAVKRFPGESR